MPTLSEITDAVVLGLSLSGRSPVGKGEIEFSKKGIMEVKSLLPGDQCVPHRVHGRPRGMDAYDIVDFYLDSDQDGVCAKIVNKL